MKLFINRKLIRKEKKMKFHEYSKGRMCMWVSNVCLCALLGTFILKVPNSCGVLNCPPCTHAKMRAHKHTQHSGDILPVFVWLLRKHMRRFSTSAYETNGSEMLHVESQFLSNSHPACLWTLWVHEWRPKRFSSETFCVRENVRASRSFCFHCCGSVLSQYGVKTVCGKSVQPSWDQLSWIET